MYFRGSTRRDELRRSQFVWAESRIRRVKMNRCRRDSILLQYISPIHTDGVIYGAARVAADSDLVRFCNPVIALHTKLRVSERVNRLKQTGNRYQSRGTLGRASSTLPHRPQSSMCLWVARWIIAASGISVPRPKLDPCHITPLF